MTTSLTKQWLYQKYVTEQLSIEAISIAAGRSAPYISKKIKEFEIPPRPKEWSNKHKELNDREWLLTQYTHLNKLPATIAQEIGCYVGTVRKALKRHKIPMRDPSQASMASRIDDGFFIQSGLARSVFEGSMLGDASIVLQPSGRSARFAKSNINLDHVKFVATALFLKEPTIRTITRGDGLDYRIISQCKDWLVREYHRWYPDGIKHIPEDFELDQTALLHWFLDDGSSSFVGPMKRRVVCARLHTESFTRTDQERLLSQLYRLGIDASIYTRSKADIRGEPLRYIGIKSSEVNNFFSAIGECPQEVSSLQYKWKTSDHEVRGQPEHFAHYKNEKWLRHHYYTEELSLRGIANIVGCHPDTIREWMIGFNLPMRPKSGDEPSQEYLDFVDETHNIT